MSDPFVFSYKVKGLDELQKALEEIPRQLSKNAVGKSLRAAGDEMKETMAVLAPKDTGFLSEHFGVRLKFLKDGIGGSAFVGPDGHMDYPRRGVGTAGPMKGGKHIGSTISVAAVARYFEFGTTKMGKKPFLTQAWEMKKERCFEIIRDTLRVELITAALQKAMGSIR